MWIVYHIEGHAIAQKYNLNPNKNIVFKNQQNIKSLNILKETLSINPSKETLF
jgi:hypothetical protein